MTAPGTPVETLPLAQPFGTGHREPQALREMTPADARSAADEAPKALHRTGDWTSFLVRILGSRSGASAP